MARSRVTELIQNFNALNEVEKQVFLDQVDPQPEPEKVKQTRKKRGPSKKAQSLSAAISKTPKADTDADEAAERAQEPIARKCGICGNEQGHPDHDRTYLKSHDFEAPKSVTGAAKKSPRKSGSTAGNGLSTASSGTVREGAGGAAQEASASASAA